MGLPHSDEFAVRRRDVFGAGAFEHVRLAGDDELLWIVLNRPTKLNAMTDLMLREFIRIYEHIELGPWRCVIVAGEGRAFCAGADLAQIGTVIDFADCEQVRDYLDTGWQHVVGLMRSVGVPTIAAVHGPAYGGGANLALAADLVIAAESAVFCQSYVDRGISPDLGGTVLLPRLVGAQQARRLLLLAEPLSAADALRIGMVTEVVTDERLFDRAGELGRALATKDPHAVRIIRELLEQNATLDVPSGLRNESRGVGATLAGPIFRAAAAKYRSAGSDAGPHPAAVAGTR